MPSTLLTGANGSFAAHLIEQLISDGHRITGTVRSLSKGEQLLSVHPEWKDKIDFVEVPELSKPGAWDSVIKKGNFDYVIHNAAPMPSGAGAMNFDRDFLEPSVNGNLEFLKAAKAYGPEIKSIVVVGSVSAVTDYPPANRTFTNKDWSPDTVDDARETTNPLIHYLVGKKEAEKAVWKFVGDEKPHFSVTVLLPCLIIGPTSHYVGDIKQLDYANRTFYSYIDGTLNRIPPTGYPSSYIDARDLALAHVRALTIPAAANKRFLLGGFPFTATIAIESLRSLPELAGRLPTEPAEEEVPMLKIDVSEAEQVFGIKYRTADETFHDTVKRLLELEKLFGTRV